MKTYNGHKNYNYWNVSLWINNDEGLYRLAMECLQGNTREQAVSRFMSLAPDATPDGVPFLKSYVYAAMRGM